MPDNSHPRTVRRHALIAMALALAMAFSAQMPTSAEAEQKQTTIGTNSGFSTLNSAELAAMLEDKDFFFVNVHIPHEGEIEGTDALIAFDKIAEHLGELPQDKNAKIVLYCRSGRMSEIAAGELATRGYRRVSHLSGGMIDWQASGHSIVAR